MAITWSGGAPGARAPERRAPDPIGVARAVLLLGWAVVALAAWGLGSAPGTYAELQQGLRDGRVTEVWAQPGFGDAPPGVTESSGAGQQRVQWREGWLNRRAEVSAASPGEAPLRADLPFVGADVVAELRAIAPDVQVHRLDEQLPSRSAFQGYELPQWAGMLAVCLFISSLTLLAGGPEPWWATRWAWFWVSLLPGGVIAFLLASGPLPRLPRALVRQDGAWRLGGGWALLLAAVLWWS